MSAGQPVDIQQDVVMNLVAADGVSLPVSCVLSFRSDDPYAVHVAFDTGEQNLVVWTFARQLMDDGTRETSGVGDVLMGPAPTGVVGQQRLTLALSSPTGSAVFEIDQLAITDFLASTYALVPAGSEIGQLDLDAELSSVLAGNG